MLSTSNCLIDSHWIVKLTDFGIRNLLSAMMAQGEIRAELFIDQRETIRRQTEASVVPTGSKLQ
jgi:hypothetical protein